MRMEGGVKNRGEDLTESLQSREERVGTSREVKEETECARVCVCVRMTIVDADEGQFVSSCGKTLRHSFWPNEQLIALNVIASCPRQFQKCER